mmetsp:Transcript_74255/g.123940  ORF Transcript_74255/g.123940 Transcript_74255/m.123940 type:complete len:281 (+) Transcript_74255:21-863(+)|eukprot:CAMPEP_0119314406 /NCGR_PEP_ID=MMETSP1333-20130426/32661_1 /TAXON_ID=418940 /ORGANISM="Scyphosphaera apsteinii, Strain RCC1455" /LENGTH=280 /DNA_ID=CAMNT_0007319507 /DNA_START=21 /DNA_END=863 /DNA_ORIENTATION=+
MMLTAPIELPTCWPVLSRRALLPLPMLLFAAPPAAPGADTFEYVEDGKVKQLTELEARGALTKKVNAATEAGKGIDVNKRGQFNEKALFSEDFYFKYGLRPTPSEVMQSPFLPPQAELPFAPISRRYNGYSKFSQRIQSGLALYSGSLRSAIENEAWADVSVLLEKGSKGKGSNSKGEGTAVPASELRSACRAFGLFANTVLQSENDNGSTTANLLARHLINELYFSMDDIALAAQAGDKASAQTSWTRGKEYLNGYIRIVNFPISSKVGDKFALVDVGI